MCVVINVISMRFRVRRVVKTVTVILVPFVVVLLLLTYQQDQHKQTTSLTAFTQG